MNCCTYTNEVNCNERSWISLHVSFESLFSLTKLSNMAIVDFQTSEVDTKLVPFNLGP
jgi:hypothetical protein